MGVGQLSESDAVDALRLPFYSSSHPTGSHGCRNQFDLGNPDLEQKGQASVGTSYLPPDGCRNLWQVYVWYSKRSTTSSGFIMSAPIP